MDIILRQVAKARGRLTSQIWFRSISRFMLIALGDCSRSSGCSQIMVLAG